MLVNWGHVYRGGLPICSFARLGDDVSPTLDELQAAEVERIIVRMKIRRPRFWKLARLYYLKGKPIYVVCQALRCSERHAYEVRARMFAYVAGALHERDPPKPASDPV